MCQRVRLASVVVAPPATNVFRLSNFQSQPPNQSTQSGNRFLLQFNNRYLGTLTSNFEVTLFHSHHRRAVSQPPFSQRISISYFLIA